MSHRVDLAAAAVITIAGGLVRLPYLILVPVFTDAVQDTMYALSIGPGFWPLRGIDPYVGPVYVYLLASWLRLVGTDPFTPHLLIAILGALTVGMTYLLARASGLALPWAMLAGLLMAANPHHILINSHISGTTYSVPLFSTAFIAALAYAVQGGRERGPWLIAAGALAGLALQGSPAVGLIFPGVAVWFLAIRPVIGLRTHWPYLAALAFVVAFGPMLYYNLRYGLVGVAIAGSRSYVWQPTLDPGVYMGNLGRLLLELAHQVGGVLSEGDERLSTLTGFPMLMAAWAAAGVAFAVRKRGSALLPVAAVASQVLLMPALSRLYGNTSATRFTNHLTPMLMVVMAAFAAHAWSRARAMFEQRGAERKAALSRLAPIAAAALVALSLAPLLSLARYYRNASAQGQTNEAVLSFYGEFMRGWRGERVLISESVGKFNPAEYFMAVNRVPYAVMPAGRILERLATGQEQGAVYLMLHRDDVPAAQAQADLVECDSPAARVVAGRYDFGVFRVAGAGAVRKPGFVLTAAELPALQPVEANWSSQLGIAGYQVRPERPRRGDEVVVNVYWKALGSVPEDYTGFLHLMGPDGQLAAQDDHELGRGLYRSNYWQAGEIIRERYVLNLPADIRPGDMALWVGAYSFPSLKRLPVTASATRAENDAVMLGKLVIQP